MGGGHMSMNFRWSEQTHNGWWEVAQTYGKGYGLWSCQVQGRIQDFLFDFVYLLFIFIFFYYFENIEEENNIIISYDRYDPHDHQFQKINKMFWDSRFHKKLSLSK